MVWFIGEIVQKAVLVKILTNRISGQVFTEKSRVVREKKEVTFFSKGENNLY